MSEPQFRTMLLGEYSDPKRALHRKFALRMWLAYYVETERYDRSLPHAMSPHDCAIPITPEAKRHSDNHARAIERATLWDLHRFGCSDEEIDQAREFAARLDYHRQVSLLGSLNEESEAEGR